MTKGLDLKVATEVMEVVDIQNIPVDTQAAMVDTQNILVDTQDAHHVQQDNTCQQELQLVLV